MRLIFLNTYKDTLKEELLDFINKNLATTDIFCFQEMDETFFHHGQKLLVNFTGNILLKNGISGVSYKLATFFSKNLVNKSKTRLINNETDIGIAEKYTFFSMTSEFSVSNVHGIPTPADKLDSPSRLRQTEEILKWNMDSAPKIIGGDFNLLPETESIKEFERLGFRNLIKEFNIKSTRNHDVWNKLKASPYGYFGKQDFADYIFVSPEVKVENFEVPDVAVSDHLPLILDFEI